MPDSAAGGAALLPADASSQIEQWLEFEEAELRRSLPDVSATAAPGPAAEPLLRLASAVAGPHCLVGAALTLADVAIYATLLPVLSKLPVSCLLTPLSRSRSALLRWGMQVGFWHSHISSCRRRCRRTCCST